ncbi:dephospho-CoA kinase [Clostridium algidicarnis]|uniref:dephospho-CoA kinase n=1 Tax=Clostridium algidicarnis TaxID=37659 RepID=UPI000495C042|nr:dephospho-CoA kinase [Clostridium algidicarnis]MBU3194553.1 dephospho-CoA kinase [Clostridium algidicarnis]MBU3202685.1 dephospho-CoA kinase [Clostridium algidicarnis]MBU3206844.1 dephospho-CoA kinase [Clostridium algidicarnis]MBU3210839.1 dephospho-CoA kinase [Clostridium algidicarnis]MBU3222653.1 dephospho-CoA kinase [Clostridium algidicarnis]
MLKIGLTGGIATGKSTVSSMLKEEGFAFIDADIVSIEVFTLYPSLTDELKRTFSETFFYEDGALKRREFGNYIFKYSKERVKYENIIIPLIKDRIKELFDEYEKKGEKVVILDAPTLIENNMQDYVDYIILVWTNSQEQIKRLINRNNFTREEAMDRINSQMNLEKKKKYVDFIIDNSDSIESTKEEVHELISLIKMLNN